MTPSDACRGVQLSPTARSVLCSSDMHRTRAPPPPASGGNGTSGVDPTCVVNAGCILAVGPKGAYARANSVAGQRLGLDPGLDLGGGGEAAGWDDVDLFSSAGGRRPLSTKSLLGYQHKRKVGAPCAFGRYR